MNPDTYAVEAEVEESHWWFVGRRRLFAREIVKLGDVCAIPFADDSFDLVVATDIVEHVDDDGAALAEIARVLKPEGSVLLTVPAFESLWGLQDDVSQHKRRYRAAQLLAVVGAARLVPKRWYYFNFLLFLPIWLARQIIRIFRIPLASENQLSTPTVNLILNTVFRLDVDLAPKLNIPFGVSFLTIASKAR